MDRIRFVVKVLAGPFFMFMFYSLIRPSKVEQLTADPNPHANSSYFEAPTGLEENVAVHSLDFKVSLSTTFLIGVKKRMSPNKNPT